MTEVEWLACGDPERMLRFAKKMAAGRKGLLFACACCRHIWRLLSDYPSRRGVEVVETLADQPSAAAAEEAERLLEALDSGTMTPATGDRQVAERAVYYALQAAVEDPWWVATSWENVVLAMEGEELLREQTARLAAGGVAEGDIQIANDELLGGWEEAWMGSGATQGWTDLDPPGILAPILREAINPFRPPPGHPTWVTRVTARLAQAAYENRELPSGHLDPARLAVLSDALEEAGCTDADLLSHLRSPGPHVRGCWALDLVLAKG